MRVTGLLAVLPVLPVCTAFKTWRPIRELERDIVDGDTSAALTKRTTASLTDQFPAYNLTVPIDHFHNDSIYEPHTNDTFQLRYWYDASHYRPGGPVIVLASGETSGVNRLPFLQKGLLARLAQSTNGIGVVLEHRYYGTSFPYDNLTTESLRFLRMEQALADTAYFAENVVFNVTEDTSPSKAPWIIYGGSYAGVFAALARIIYPDVFWGAISSSGVTVAIYDYWEYYEAHRLYAPKKCMSVLEKLIHAVDQILLPKARSEDYSELKKRTDNDNTARITQLKEVFGLGNLTHNDDFAAVVSSGLDPFQGTNWDPAVSDPDFGYFCGNLTADKALYPDLGDRSEAVQSLLGATSYHEEIAELTQPMLNFIGWVEAAHPCAPGKTQDQCFGNHNTTFYQQDDLSQRWRAWPYQFCTQWGYLPTGSGVPADRLPLVSRLLTTEYHSTICREAFGIHELPDLESVNKYGNYSVHYPRVAFIDGEADPWRAATVHAIGHDEPGRTSTVSEPFILIAGGAVHHWDENGLLPEETTEDLPPLPIRKVQAAEEEFVLEWVAAFEERLQRDVDGYYDDGRV